MSLYWDKLLNPVRRREIPETLPSPNESRSYFKKDFDAVCNSTVLRRLQDKAQVFPLEDGDYARTRLTHSIETMSIADSLGAYAVEVIKKAEHKRYWSSDPSKGPPESLINQIPMILETVALLHDMGNPPFGHLGEGIIAEWFKNHMEKLSFDNDWLLVSGGSSTKTLDRVLTPRQQEDLRHFDGNAQLFRLVNKLSFTVDDNGMNLTYPVMAAFIKYPTSSERIDPSRLFTKKLGFFSAEEDIYRDINQTLGLNGYRHPLAFLLEAADDIAYLTADLEDAHKKGIISMDAIRNYLERAKSDALIEKVLGEMAKYQSKAQAFAYAETETYVVHRLRVLMKGWLIDRVCSAFAEHYEEIMECRFCGELIKVSAGAALAEILQTIQKERIYYSPEILRNKTRATTIIKTLLDTYVIAAVNWTKSGDQGRDTSNNLIYQSFSKNYRYRCKQANSPYSHLTGEELVKKTCYHKLLLATDQIAGMTDTHALAVYHDITAR